MPGKSPKGFLPGSATDKPLGYTSIDALCVSGGVYPVACLTLRSERSSVRPEQILYDFLAVREPVGPADVIVGFGHFDVRVPQRCAELWHQGMAPLILFSGREGRGTPDDVGCEAEWFAQIAEQRWNVPRAAIRLETKSGNTLENVRNCDAIVDAHLNRWIAVASPCMQLRIALTVSRQTRRTAISSPPVGDVQDEVRIYAAAGEDCVAWMLGEIGRLDRYASKGDIDRCTIPDQVLQACNQLMKDNYPSPPQPSP